MLDFIATLFTWLFFIAIIFLVVKYFEKIQHKKKYDYRVHFKTIYALNYNINNKVIKEILVLECKNFSSQNQGYKFHRYLGFMVNKDGSHTYKLIFKKVK